MGRPCLVPNFSYLSEVGASFLDDQLQLGLVPKTRLVGLASPSFHYTYKDRTRYERGAAPLPTKLGSLQQFLENYENVSEFLRHHSLPGRPHELTERELSAEQSAHRLSRRKQRARLRMAFIAAKRLLLCRYGPGPYGSRRAERPVSSSAPVTDAAKAYPAAASIAPTTRSAFQWTARTWREFRLELEKLVVLDFLMRNTDRGLDNFMITYDPAAPAHERSVRIGAIDNALAFPHQHPRGLRDYPYGWLFLPTSVIGDAFSDETRALFLPKLTDPVWWAGTVDGLRTLFAQDAHFHERTFQNQMAVLRGQGYVLVQCLQRTDQGPVELVAYPKRLVRQSIRMVLPKELAEHTVTDLRQGVIVRCAADAPRPVPAPPAATAEFVLAAGSLPTDGAFPAAAALEPLAIEVVERIQRIDKGGVKGSATPTHEPRAARHTHQGHAYPARPPLGRHRTTDLAPPTRRVSQQMQSLDLAADVLDLARTDPFVPIPVLVERLETETRRPWIWWC